MISHKFIFDDISGIYNPAVFNIQSDLHVSGYKMKLFHAILVLLNEKYRYHEAIGYWFISLFILNFKEGIFSFKNLKSCGLFKTEENEPIRNEKIKEHKKNLQLSNLKRILFTSVKSYSWFCVAREKRS